MTNHTIRVYDDETSAKRAYEELIQQGYSKDQISVLAKNPHGLIGEEEEVNPSATDGAVAGAAAGGVLGLTGFLVGVSALAIPGIGPILAAGPLLATVGGAAAGAASGAGLSKPLMDLGLTEEEASQYVDDIKNGKILIAIEK
ncbi:general stress protein [Bacillus massiliglaciei]|uniref:general stress protein n=1 Tax=Bacillus massiliglaciei TaxID=1816693 RepID=UPI000AA88F30|nr:general stress protein [Bacillus massiliglaciei]